MTSGDVERPWDTQKPAEKTGKRPMGCFAWAGIFIAVLIVGSLYSSWQGDGDGDVSDPEARNQCQEWVKDKLKAPSTAKFSDVTVAGGDPSWTVSGSVDAENSFGGTARSTWTCSIRIDGDTWRGSASVQ